MATSAAWKLATGVLGATSLVLAAALALRESAVTSEAEPDAESTSAAPADSRAPRRRIVRRERAAAPTAHERGGAAGVPRPAAAADSGAAELDAMTIDDVCLTWLLAGPFSRTDWETLMTRLRRDPERAAAITEDWLRRWQEIQRETGVTIRRSVAEAYAELRGAAAAPLLRELYEQGRAIALPGLVRAGDPDFLSEVDVRQRAAAPDDLIKPRVFATSGEHGVALVRGWAFAEGVAGPLREASQGDLWIYGTDDDRERLLREADPAFALSQFITTISPSRDAWRGRTVSLAARLLDSADPWLRLHAERHLLLTRRNVGNEAVRRALVRAADDVQLPRPDGRDPDAWAQLQSDVQRLAASAVEVPERRRRLREVLGLVPDTPADEDDAR